MSITYLEKILDINGHKAFMNANIVDVLVADDLVVVRTDDGQTHGSGDKSMNRNVLAFDQNANLVWTIQEAPHGGDEWPKPYTHVTKRGNQLIAGTWIGVDYIVDPKTGNVDAGENEGRPW